MNEQRLSFIKNTARAKKLLDQAEKGEITLSAKEKADCQAQVRTSAEMQTAWTDNADKFNSDFEKLPVFKTMENDLMNSAVSSTSLKLNMTKLRWPEIIF